jgi:cytidylate kinase
VSAITITSSYGAAASAVAPAVAERMGYELLDRAIPVAVAERLALPLDRVLARDEQLEPGFGGLVARISAAFAPIGAVMPPEAFHEDAFKTHTEEVVRHLAEGRGAVIVGRAAAVILAGRADTFHVRLDGPQAARIRQAARALGISVADARRQLAATDPARAEYWAHFYRCEWSDPRLFHLWIDSTAIPVDTCVELIVTAATARFGTAPSHPA